VQDLAINVLHSALSGLSARQRVLSDNVANIETPRFLAGRVDFEDSLRRAIKTGEAGSAEITSRQSLDPGLPNGNNVNLNKESLSLVDTELRYQLAVQGINSKFSLLRTSIGGGA
jgi:flagellar basal-body rod protein FlgB